MKKKHTISRFIAITTNNISDVYLNVKLVVYCLIILNVKIFGLKCVCNPSECDIIRSEDCPGKGLIVWDPCRCCRVCARTYGEACGGPGDFSGTCEPPLSCVSKIPVSGSGICLDVPLLNNGEAGNFQNCTETVFIESGCEIVNRKCKCWDKMELCKTKSIAKWDFQNIEECQLNIANLVRSELEFDEDYTVPPKSTTENSAMRKTVLANDSKITSGAET
ncbi:cysteine-rich motor neuron 1 protein-like isoform X3 [Toxorhynchites rutilus septentrionalis]|uniref:cysteine-rich motor neuron 1 protein-like isoform X3 n=1 Tax=Toxorhynchites rutilus septentrionalis TaxID=329112 RepID=UPI00247AA45B|nr:cysteine-rich motor neuron 1 protein-like isoform X3 [Toxorhynchites rutilus septentrionalis]